MEQAVQRLVDNVVTQNHVTTLMAPVWTDVRQVLREHYVQKVKYPYQSVQFLSLINVIETFP